MMLQEYRGIYYDMPNEDYHAVNALNASRISTLVEYGQWHCYMEHLNPQRERTTRKCFEIGTIIHAATLEPLRYQRDYKVLTEDKPRRGTKAWEKLETATAEELVTLSEGKQISRCVQRVREEHPISKFLLSEGHAEVSFFWSETHDGLEIPCKARLDWARPDWIVDLKTCADARFGEFSQDCHEYLYDVKAAWYLRCALQFPEFFSGLPQYALIAVEPKYPSLCNVFVYDLPLLRDAFERMEQAIGLWVDGVRNGWDRKDMIPMPVAAPRWNKRRPL